MAIQRMDHVGVVVDDLAAAVDFFERLGLEVEGEAELGGELVNRVLGLEGVRTEVAMMQTPDGHGRLELTKFHTPPAQGADGDPPPNAVGLRHVTFAVDDLNAVLDDLRDRGFELVGELVNYQDTYWLCYVRGPEGIIVELAERIG
jgi:catechol 2,3-dioxygenase-like lactoylglutathione lyase family enzyme